MRRFGQLHNVVSALAQRRDLRAIKVEPMMKILAEFARSDHC